MSKRYDRKQLMHRVQIAIRELHLASMTQAGKKRLAYVEQGLFALDEEQALLKSGIEDLVKAFETKVPLMYQTEADIELLKGLKKLVTEQRPRVNYPDRKLVEEEEPKRTIPLKGPAPAVSTVRSLKRVQKDLHKIPKTSAKVR